jgi:hypothetical protein
MRQKVPQQMPSQAGNDARPVVSEDLEHVFFEGANLVADKASYGHENILLMWFQKREFGGRLREMLWRVTKWP